MDNNHTGNSIDDDSSAYIGASETGQLDLGGLFSGQFANIHTLYASATGPAVIYTATRYGKRFILKGLREEFRDDPIYNLALAKEFEIGIFLEHPNIRHTIGLEEVESLGKVIVMEYIDGMSLSELIASRQLTKSEARYIALQIADALGYIHSKQVYHRDLKPSNILVSHNGNAVKVIDFNLSDSDAFVVLKNPAGSKKYMAPELLSSEAVHTASADIYSFGVIMSDLAEATGDELLAEVADKCRNNDPNRRPHDVAQIKLPSHHPSILHSVSTLFASRTLTWILSAICIGLAVYNLILLSKL